MNDNTQYKELLSNITLIANNLSEITRQPREDIEKILLDKLERPKEFKETITTLNVIFNLASNANEAAKKAFEQIPEDAPLNTQFEAIHNEIKKSFISPLQKSDNERVQEYVAAASAVMEDMATSMQAIAAHLEDLEAVAAVMFARQILEPYIKTPTEQPQPIKDYTSEIIKAINAAAEIIDESSPHIEAIKAAREKAGITNQNLENIATGKTPELGRISFDKITDLIFNDIPMSKAPIINIGDFNIDVTSDQDKKKNKPPVLVSVRLEQKLEELEADPRIKIKGQAGQNKAFRELSPEMKQLFMALWAINEESGKDRRIRATPDIICNTLYRSAGAASSNQIDKMFKLLTTLGATRISIDNIQEAAAYPSKERVNITDAPLLSYFCIERFNAFGEKTTEIYFDRSIIWDFIERRGHFTTPPLKVAKPYLSLTAINAALEDYLKGRIAQMKRKGSKYIKKIRYETIYKKLNTQDRRQKLKIREKTEEVLKALKKDNYIKDFKIYPNKTKPEGIEIILKN